VDDLPVVQYDSANLNVNASASGVGGVVTDDALARLGKGSTDEQTAAIGAGSVVQDRLSFNLC
jgi:hypothetical protein